MTNIKLWFLLWHLFFVYNIYLSWLDGYTFRFKVMNSGDLPAGSSKGGPEKSVISVCLSIGKMKSEQLLKMTESGLINVTEFAKQRTGLLLFKRLSETDRKLSAQ